MPMPLLLQFVSKKLPVEFSEEQRKLVATIVHNAGIYNSILAGGLLWAALPGGGGSDAARVLLWGGIVAGVFGAVTLKSVVPAVQALVCLAVLFLF